MPRTATLFLVLVALLLAACAHRYRVTGLVVDVNHNEGTMTVSHRAIPGYMDAMAMRFQVRSAAELRPVQPGDRVEFRLVVKGRSSYVEGVRAGSSAEVANAGRGEAPLPLPVPVDKLAPGMAMPDFELADQSGRPVRLFHFAGQVVAVNFIYTRCPLPEVCPRLSAHFAYLQRRFKQQMGKGLALFSITLDPQHDTPAVLADYAKRWGTGEGWYLLTGDPGGIQAVASRFGVVYWAEEGLLAHTSQTGIVGRDGRLVALIEGSSYDEVQLGDFIALQLEANHDSHRHALGVAR